MSRSSPAWPWHRRIARLAVPALLLILAVSGCAQLGAMLGPVTVLQGAGYQHVSVNVVTGAGLGLPTGGLVEVSYSHGPTGNDQRDALKAERIVWDTLHDRFGTLVIVKTSGGCTGPGCVSRSGAVASATYAQLAARFGPRPRGLDAPGGVFGIPVRTIALDAGLTAVIIAAITVALVWFMRRGRRSTPRRPLVCRAELGGGGGPGG